MKLISNIAISLLEYCNKTNLPDAYNIFELDINISIMNIDIYKFNLRTLFSEFDFVESFNYKFLILFTEISFYLQKIYLSVILENIECEMSDRQHS